MVGASIDARIVEWAASHRYAPVNGFFVALGTVEKLGLIWAVMAFALALLARRRLSSALLFAGLTLMSTFGADAVSFGLKDLVGRPRPAEAHPQIHPLYAVHSSSFPAGHAATAFAGATVLSYFAPRLAPFFAALAALIGVSRIYVGDHYPTDVLAGAAIGVLVGAAAIAIILLLGRATSIGRLRPLPG